MTLRIPFIQQWFSLSDPAMEEGLYDSDSIRNLAKLWSTRDVASPERAIDSAADTGPPGCAGKPITGISTLDAEQLATLKSLRVKTTSQEAFAAL